MADGADILTRIAQALRGRGGADALPSADVARYSRLGMTPRQQRLNYLWGWYCGQQYAERAHDWDGGQRMDLLEQQQVAGSGLLPPSYYTTDLPLKFRRPTAPYRLPTVITDRFTSLLFSERRHPRLVTEGDPDTEDYALALAEVSRLWPQMIQARTFGGSMGSVAVSFKFVEGVPRIEVHDPRWCIPSFLDRETFKLKRLEKFYMFPKDVLTAKGTYRQEWYWYRRVIDTQRDVIYAETPVGDGQRAIEWVEEVVVEHGFGFCPAVWIQNLPDQDNIDGIPDCESILELVESIDALHAQANKGVAANCDPTLVLKTDADIDDTLKKGSNNAIKLPGAGDARYLEMTGSGPKAATELADRFRALALEVAQCVLDSNDTVQKTATEIERSYSAMLAKADMMREQYGQRGVLPLMRMMVAAARMITDGSVLSPEGQRMALVLPARFVDPDGPDGIKPPVRVDRKLGPAEVGVMSLRWGPYFTPTVDETLKAVQAAVAAKAGGIVDDEHAAKFIADYFHIENPQAMLARQEQKAADQQAALDRASMLASAVQPAEPSPPEPDEAEEADAETDQASTQTA